MNAISPVASQGCRSLSMNLGSLVENGRQTKSPRENVQWVRSHASQVHPPGNRHKNVGVTFAS
jgi:hypothetical protein